MCLCREKLPRTAALVLLGLALGQLWSGMYDMVRLAPVRSIDGQTMKLTLTAVDYSFESDYGITFDGSANIRGRTYRVRAYLNQREGIEPGTQVTGTFRLRYTAPGGLEDATHHSGKGILLLAYPKGDHRTEAPAERAWRYFPAYLRGRIQEILVSIFPADALPFAKALLLGDTSDLDYETDTDLAVSGLRHVAAVSGLHVSILFSLIYLFAGKRRVLSAVAGIPVLVLFAAMAGFSPSIVRAAVMQGLMLLAMLLRKEYDPPTALAFAVLVMLGVNPLAATSVGLQLSVASVCGIFLLGKPINSWLMAESRLGRFRNRRIARWMGRLSASVSISLGAMLMTTPLTAWYFGTANLLSILTNLLCLWVVTVLFCGIIAACIVGALWLPVGKLLGSILAWAVRYVLTVSGFVAGIPLAAVYTKSVYIVAWLVLCYLLLAVHLLFKSKRVLLLGCCVVLSLCFALLASWTEPLLDDYRLTALDVGQGQCILLQSEGKTYMVDCGGSYDEDAADTAASYLLAQGVTRLDGLILTHYDQDHVGGAAYLLHRVPADVLVLPVGEDAQRWDPELLKNHTGHVIRASQDYSITWGSCEITVYASQLRESSNESSLCVLFQREECDILITGDRGAAGEEALLRTADIPQVDVLVAGHHGAASATSMAFLEAVRPATVLISVGEGNRYDHPSQEVLDRLTAFGCVIRRTDLEGTIIYRG